MKRYAVKDEQRRLPLSEALAWSAMIQFYVQIFNSYKLSKYKTEPS